MFKLVTHDPEKYPTPADYMIHHGVGAMYVLCSNVKHRQSTMQIPSVYYLRLDDHGVPWVFEYPSQELRKDELSWLHWQQMVPEIPGYLPDGLHAVLGVLAAAKEPMAGRDVIPLVDCIQERSVPALLGRMATKLGYAERAVRSKEGRRSCWHYTITAAGRSAYSASQRARGNFQCSH